MVALSQRPAQTMSWRVAWHRYKSLKAVVASAMASRLATLPSYCTNVHNMLLSIRSALCASAHLPVSCLLLAATARVTVACEPSWKLLVLWWCCSACPGAWRPPCRLSLSSRQLRQPCTGAARGLLRQRSRQRCSEWRGLRTRPSKTCGPLGALQVRGASVRDGEGEGGSAPQAPFPPPAAPACQPVAGPLLPGQSAGECRHML